MTAPRQAPGRLHVITDETLQSRFTHLELARLASTAGADVVQFREKRGWPTLELLRVALAMREAVGAGGTRLIVNDRVDVAAAVAADGVHLGLRDASPELARRLLGGAATIGATANDALRLSALARAPVGYVGVGPVFGTRSKAGAIGALGLDGLERLVRASAHPVIAIGNITPERVAGVLATGAYGIAVLSDVVCSADPAERVGRFGAALREAVVEADHGAVRAVR